MTSSYVLTVLSIIYTATRWSQIPDDLEYGTKYIINGLRKVQPIIISFVNVCTQKVIKECQRRGLLAEPAAPPRPPKLHKIPKPDTEVNPNQKLKKPCGHMQISTMLH